MAPRVLPFVLLALAACRRNDPGLELFVGDVAPDGAPLDFSETAQGAGRNFEVRARSTYPRPLRLVVRIEEPVPLGMTAKFDPPLELLPMETKRSTLVVAPPRALGPFSGTLTVHAEGDAAIRRSFPFAGEVVPAVYPGPYVRFDPAGIDLGTMRPGEVRPFVLTVRAIGTEPIEIYDWHPMNPRALELRGVNATERIVPGGELQVNGRVKAPEAAGRFVEVVRVESNARNLKRYDYHVSGVVVPRYEPIPPRFVERLVRSQHPRAVVRLNAGEGEPPFVVGAVAGGERWFDVESLGSSEPAASQTVELRLRPDAPIGPASLTLALRVDPEGLVVAWPVEIDVRPNVEPEPPRLAFPRVPRGSERRAEVVLHSYVPGRVVRVLEVRAPRFLNVEVSAPAGLPPALVVRLVPDLPAGVYQDPPIEVLTDDPDTPRVLVPVRVEVVE